MNLKSLISQGRKAHFELEGRKAIIAFRLIILALAIFFTLYNQELTLQDVIRSGPFAAVLLLAGLHLASNVLLALVPPPALKKGLFVGVFFFDIALISAVIYLTQGFETDLFLIYFLVIFMTVVSRQSASSFFVAGIGCVLYGFLFLRNHTMDELLRSSVLIRFPLFLIVAFFSHVIVRDIEEEKRALLESEEKFRQLAENIREIFWLKDRGADRMIYVSPGYERVWGRARRALYESLAPWTDSIHPEDRQRVLASQKDQAFGSYDEEYRILRSDGHIVWVRDRAFPIADSYGRVYRIAGIAEDITRTKTSEETVRKEGEMKSRFATMVSHELRTPLSVIKAASAVIQDGTAGTLNEKQTHFMKVIDRNMDRLQRLVNDVLDYTKLQAGKVRFQIKENDLNALIREVGESFLKPAQEKGLYVKMELDPAIKNVKLDSDKIVQVLTNLLNNAVKFTDSGGVTLTSALEKGGQNAIVGVKDTGAGIKEPDLEKLFQEFQQLSNTHVGTGLGLAICKEIIDSHSGRIWAESVYGSGAEFIFTLPVS